MNVAYFFARVGRSVLLAGLIAFAWVIPANAQGMSADKVSETVSGYWTALSALNIEAALELFADDAVSFDPFGVPPVEGAAARREAFLGLAQAFETLRFSQDSVHISGNRAAVKWSSVAKMKDGRSVEFAGIDVFEINSDGKIQTLWGYWDPSILFPPQKN